MLEWMKKAIMVQVRVVVGSLSRSRRNPFHTLCPHTYLVPC